MFKFALSGKKNSGKNTVAKLLMQHFNPKAVATVAFADSLKDTVKIFFPWIPNLLLDGESRYRDLEYTDLQKYTESSNLSFRNTRDLIKFLAQEIKTINPDICLDVVKYKYQKLMNDFSGIDNSLIIISDIRFINEFKWAKQEKFYTLRIKKNFSKLDNDVTETSQDQISDSEFDLIIDNSKDLNALDQKIKTISQLAISNMLSLKYE